MLLFGPGEALALQCTTETFGGLCRHCPVLEFVLFPMKLHGDIPMLFVDCYFGDLTQIPSDMIYSMAAASGSN